MVKRKKTRSRRSRVLSGKIVVEFLTKHDMSQYETYFQKIKRGIQLLGNYNPDLDDFFIEQAARGFIYVNKAEEDIDKAKTIREKAIATDILSKNQKRLNDALQALAANRGDRLQGQSLQDATRDVREAINQIIYGKKKHEK